MTDESFVGDLINFRGLVYSPMNENGVIFLFGKVVEDLNMYVEEIKPGFPDCVARTFTGKGWKRIFIEFEHKSLNFKGHKHDNKKCDLIVCWENNWRECPIEVLELREVIKTMPNQLIQPPDRPEPDAYSLEERLVQAPKKVQTLFQEFDVRVKAISDDIWRKTAKKSITYYSPERVFIDLRLQKQGLRLHMFTRGESIEGVKSFGYEGRAEKWGQLHVRDLSQLTGALDAVKQSYHLIKDAIKNNEPTGWYAVLEAEEEEDEEMPSEPEVEER